MCKAFGMILAAPQNQDEYDRLKYLAGIHPNAADIYAAIAVTRSELNKNLWLSSGKEINFNLTWADGEPNNVYDNEHCVGNQISHLDSLRH